MYLNPKTEAGAGWHSVLGGAHTPSMGAPTPAPNTRVTCQKNPQRHGAPLWTCGRFSRSDSSYFRCVKAERTSEVHPFVGRWDVKAWVYFGSSKTCLLQSAQSTTKPCELAVNQRLVALGTVASRLAKEPLATMKPLGKAARSTAATPTPCRRTLPPECIERARTDSGAIPLSCVGCLQRFSGTTARRSLG